MPVRPFASSGARQRIRCNVWAKVEGRKIAQPSLLCVRRCSAPYLTRANSIGCPAERSEHRDQDEALDSSCRLGRGDQVEVSLQVDLARGHSPHSKGAHRRDHDARAGHGQGHRLPIADVAHHHLERAGRGPLAGHLRPAGRGPAPAHRRRAAARRRSVLAVRFPLPRRSRPRIRQGAPHDQRPGRPHSIIRARCATTACPAP